VAPPCHASFLRPPTTMDCRRIPPDGSTSAAHITHLRYGASLRVGPPPYDPQHGGVRVNVSAAARPADPREPAGALRPGSR
jgi:hypothetical protein